MKSPRCRERARSARWRGALFRFGAVMLSLSSLVLAELLLALLGWGRPSDEADPFVGFSSVRPLFAANEADGCYAIPYSRQLFFRPETFGLHKSASEFRIFCLGGSSVAGHPFATESSFTTWLELSLQAADPRRKWEVVNCGGVSYASYRLRPILNEVLHYQPDLLILCTGHNEFLEDRTYRHIKYRPLALTRALEFASQLRTYALLREGCLRLGKRCPWPLLRRRTVLSHEADAMLDYRGGLAQYHRDENWRQDVIEHFAYNLRRMVQAARQAGVPLLLVNPVSNLRDCPPFKSQHRDGLPPEKLAQWESEFAAARRLLPKHPSQALQHIRRAIALDDQYAQAFYELGKCFDAMGRTADARHAYEQAKELDVCPLRMLEPMHRLLLEIARETGTPVADAREAISRRCPQGIPGDSLMLDHVHPSIRGHQIMADLLTEAMIRQDLVRPRSDWKKHRAEKYNSHLAALDTDYYMAAEARLNSLRNWAAGKGTREPREAKGSGPEGQRSEVRSQKSEVSPIDNEAQVRAAAGEATGQLRPVSDSTTGAPVEAHQDQDERLRREIARALAGGRPKAAVGVPWLIEALDDEPVRHLAAKALGDMGPEAKDAVPALLKASRVDDDLTRFPVAEALWKITRDAPTAVALLTESLKDGVFLPTRMDAASLLAEIGPASQPAAPSLVGMLGCGNEEAARVAAHALSAIGKKAVPLVVASLSSSNPSQRQFALHALGRIGLQEPDALSAVISALRDDAWLVRLTAANTLGAAAVETQEIVSALRAATCDPHPFVRTAAAGALDVLAENRRP